MTIVAGLFAYDGRILDDQLCRSIRRVISRDPADKPSEFRAPRCYLAKVDIGAYGERAFECRGQKSVAILAGDPLLAERGREGSRTADLSLLHDAVLRSDWGVLRTAHGSFCSVHYSDNPARLTLVVDKLALRPLYCWYGLGLVAFSSALRILEGMVELKKSLDTRGLCEQLSFGYPLGDRTAYREVRCLCPGEVVAFGHDGEQRSRYWRWDSIQNASLDSAEAAPLVRDAIARAITRRLKPREASVAAFLSGGLDSRLIATVLRDSVDSLHLFTFADKELLDCFLAQEYAKRLDSKHNVYSSVRANTHPSAAYGKLLASAQGQRLACVDRPQIVWSGDGGSVCIGYVYLHSSVGELSRRKLQREAIEEFLRLNRRGLAARRVLGTAFAEIPADFTVHAMETEMDLLNCNDPAMTFYIFLLMNDQRRHLSQHFECIDVHRVELHLPLFDSDVLELMIAIPMEDGLYHKFYYDMIHSFPGILRSVPWQAYPGHLACPLPVPPGLIDQWQFSGSGNQRKAEIAEEEVNSMLLDLSNIPSFIINKRQVYIASWLAGLGVGDRAYLLRAAVTVYRHWRICNLSKASDLGTTNGRTKARRGRANDLREGQFPHN